jgi:hypothetical protein
MNKLFFKSILILGLLTFETKNFAQNQAPLLLDPNKTYPSVDKGFVISLVDKDKFGTVIYTNDFPSYEKVLYKNIKVLKQARTENKAVELNPNTLTLTVSNRSIDKVSEQIDLSTRLAACETRAAFYETKLTKPQIEEAKKLLETKAVSNKASFEEESSKPGHK